MQRLVDTRYTERNLMAEQEQDFTAHDPAVSKSGAAGARNNTYVSGASLRDFTYLLSYDTYVNKHLLVAVFPCGWARARNEIPRAWLCMCMHYTIYWLS